MHDREVGEELVGGPKCGKSSTALVVYIVPKRRCGVRIITKAHISQSQLLAVSPPKYPTRGWAPIFRGHINTMEADFERRRAAGPGRQVWGAIAATCTR